jgi:hypothetical protein
MVVKETRITMKCSICVCALVLSPVVAFLGPLHQAERVGVTVRSEAQDHMEQLAGKWRELKTKEEKLRGKHDPVRNICRSFRGTSNVSFLAVTPL